MTAPPPARPKRPKVKFTASPEWTGISAHIAAQEYKRELHFTRPGAVRMRTFHCRLSEQGVEYLDQR